MIFRRRTRILMAYLFGLLFCGCGGDLYEMGIVRGSVTTCEGKPATGGVVVFTPIDDPQATGRPGGNPGRTARGTVDEKGMFMLESDGIERVPGAVTGRHQVTFQMPPTRRPVLTADDKALLTPEDIKEAEARIANMKIYPPVPCSVRITPNEVTVVSGENMFEFTLPPK